jgi:mannan endo-1,4-beta-mannosidase
VTSTPGSGTVWFQSFVSGASPVINTGTNGLQRLDYVVASAEAHGISLIINFVNNWTDYGGMAAYCTYYGISPVTGWYTSTAAQTQYKAYIQAVVSRYTTSKAIFAWELANEPRCGGCDTSVITNWVTTISAYIKSLDPNHMVCIGDEGFGLALNSDGSYPYTVGPGTNFTTNLAIPTIDFGTFHLYPTSWGETVAWGAKWVDDHAAAGYAVGKPVILEEYGTEYGAKSNMAGWQAAVLADVVAGDLDWQYGDTLSTGVTSDDGNTVFYGSADYATYVSALLYSSKTGSTDLVIGYCSCGSDVGQGGLSLIEDWTQNIFIRPLSILLYILLDSDLYISHTSYIRNKKPLAILQATLPCLPVF